MEDKIVKSVIDRFKERSERGIEKYGKTLDRDDLSLKDWLLHLQEELMDATLYIEKLREEINGVTITKETWDKADKITHNGFVYVKFNDL